MAEKINSIIVWDTEFWTDEGAQARRWRGLADEPPILVQFAAYKVSLEEGLPVIDEIKFLMKPHVQGRKLEIREYFEDLTKISATQVEQDGLMPEAAFQKIHDFMQDSICLSYGHDVLSTLLPTAYLNNIDLKLPFAQFRDFRHLLARAGWSEAKISENSSGSVAGALGLNVKVDGDVHDAGYDSMSLLMSLRLLLKQGKLSLNDLTKTKEEHLKAWKHSQKPQI